ncbi:hypothetical protein SAMN05216559_0379 [Halomicrobium zhouii]|uniref:Uncharacterized protein n=1 Tax=Halomicrobium zhouii TaxID=767519 RepID=A0A1I6K8N0_9EURY|nr:hypothetical protein SAMN05216559_0379 [Halomicrobium zhouii]
MPRYVTYCPHCEDEQRVLEDKPWLPTVCLRCGRWT